MNERFLKNCLLSIGSIFLLVFCLAPFIYMIAISLQDHPDFLNQLAPSRISLDHYAAVLQTRSLHFPSFLRNSLVISLLSALICVWIAGLAAYAITRFRLPGKQKLLFCILAASMFPQISLINYLFKLMTRLGWINTYPALIFPYIAWTLPLALWILISYFAQIPRELDQAAEVDGASSWTIWTRVILPLAVPGMVSVGLLTFIGAFNEFLFAMMLTTDHHARTVPVGIALFQGTHGQTPWGTIMAAATLATLPVIALTLFFQRRIVQGLTRGAVKG